MSLKDSRSYLVRTKANACGPRLVHRFILLTVILLSSQSAWAEEPEEIFLGFRYQGGVNTTIIGYTKDDRIYLPVQELFRILYVNVNLDVQTNAVSGFYIQPNRRYVLDFQRYQARVGNRTYPMPADEFIVGELDTYLSTEAFSELFDLDFSADFSNLILKLVANEKLPIVIRYERERARNRRPRNVTPVAQYELTHPRRRQFLSGYFLDYNFVQQVERFQNRGTSATFTFGNETLYGDVQGTYRINNTPQSGSSTTLSGARYRYVFSENPVVTQFTAGQLNSPTLNIGNYTGVRISNQPLYQTRIFDEYIVDDITFPESEVEVYVNNRLIDVIRVDESGRYRIAIPITYGVNDVRLSIFGPNGEILESERRIDIPYAFIPKGEFRYDMGAGTSDDAFQFSTGSTRYGFASAAFAPFSFWTSTSQLESIRNPLREDLVFSTQNSFRVWNSFLFNHSYSPGHYSRTEGYYQSINGFVFRGFYNDLTGGSILNEVGTDKSYGVSTFVPIQIGMFPISTRLSVDRTVFDAIEFNNRSVEVNSRIQRVAVRGSYRQSTRTFTATNNSTEIRRLIFTGSYTIPPTRSYWAPVRGLFLRGQMDFNENLGNLEQFDVSASRRIGQNGRVQLSWLRNVQVGFNSIFFSVSFDLAAVRSSTSLRYVRDSQVNMRQSIRGSVTYDRPNRLFWFDNRQQVGRSAVTAVLFVDSDGSGDYSEGDELIPDNALRILGAGARVKSKDGFSAITQLQQYYRYDVEINKGAIRNPSLVPVKEQFSIVTDPNQHKSIMIPFERTGVIDGSVTRAKGTGEEGVGGLRLELKEASGRFETVLRTFSDGSFYQFEVPPGNYTLTVDTLQLRILDARPVPDTIRFQLKSVPDGDFVDGLAFRLEPLSAPPAVIPAPEPKAPPTQYFRIQTALMSTLARAIMVKIEVEEATGIPHEIQYSRRWDNYRVFSTEIEGLDRTLAGVEALRKLPYKDAFIINEQTFNTEDLFYAVQVGAFPDSVRAARHVADIRTQYGLEGQIQYDAISRHFKVILAPMSDFRAVSEMRERIRRETTISDAFVITQPNVNYRDLEFTVQLGRFTNQADAYRLSRRLTLTHKTENFVVQVGNRFYVRTRPTNRLEDAVTEYLRLKSEGFDAFIETIRS